MTKTTRAEASEEASRLVVRHRAADDLDACIALAGTVHAVDGYPVYLPTDLRRFLVSPDAHAAWVAVMAGEIVGHAALHRCTSPAVVAVASEDSALPVERLGVIARLFVSPDCRGAGVGTALLDAASGDAAGSGLRPILDVATGLTAAIRLYESCGWIRIGAVTVPLDDGSSLDEFVYLGPG